MLNINIWDILWTVINLLVLYFLLKKFLFGPVTAMMDRREQMIKADLDKAKQTNAQAQELKDKYEAELKDAHLAAAKISSNAKQHADKESAQIIDEAQKEASRIIAEAKKTVERERQEAVEEAKEQIAGLAVLAASRVLAKNIDEESNLVYAQQLLAEVGADDE